MVLGCYYLTAENLSQQTTHLQYFSNLEDVLLAYTQNKIGLHSYVWVRFNDPIEDESELLKTYSSSDGNYFKIYSSRILKEDNKGNLLVQYMLSTPGRVLFNKVVSDSLLFNNLV
jgi:DNA-directed RNA polymerase subunit beta'